MVGRKMKILLSSSKPNFGFFPKRGVEMFQRGLRLLFSMDRRYRQLVKVDTSKIPYAVNRTSSGNIPIYTRIRGVSRENVTYVGSVYGDTKSFISDMRMSVCGESRITEEGRTIIIDGRFAKQIKLWLHSLGF